MDMIDVRSFTLVLMFVAFVSLCIWAYSKKRRPSFDAAANLPFADESLNQQSVEHADDKGAKSQ